MLYAAQSNSKALKRAIPLSVTKSRRDDYHGKRRLHYPASRQVSVYPPTYLSPNSDSHAKNDHDQMKLILEFLRALII